MVFCTATSWYILVVANWPDGGVQLNLKPWKVSRHALSAILLLRQPSQQIELMYSTLHGLMYKPSHDNGTNTNYFIPSPAYHMQGCICVCACINNFSKAC